MGERQTAAHSSSMCTAPDSQPATKYSSPGPPITAQHIRAPSAMKTASNVPAPQHSSSYLMQAIPPVMFWYTCWWSIHKQKAAHGHMQGMWWRKQQLARQGLLALKDNVRDLKDQGEILARALPAEVFHTHRLLSLEHVASMELSSQKAMSVTWLL